MAMFEDVLSRAKSVAQSAGKKTEEMVGIAKVKMQIGDLRREITSLYEGLGRLVYDSRHSEESVDELVDACVEQLDEQLAELARLEERVMESKNVIRCDSCGSFNAQDAVFCSKCGVKLNG